MNADNLSVIIPSFLEAVAIIVIVSAINRNAKIGIIKTIMYAAIFSCSAFVMNEFQVQYHVIFSIIISIVMYLLLKKAKQKEFWKYAIDILLAIGFLALIQFAVTMIASLMSFNLLGSGMIMTCILVGIIVIFALLSRSVYVIVFFERYYLPHRTAILFIVISLLFLMTIIVNLHYYHEEAFAVGAGRQMYLIIFGYFVINLILGVSLWRIRSVNNERAAAIKYGEHLQNVVSQHRELVHDYKHHLQMVVTLNYDKSGRVRNKELDTYIESLLSDRKRMSSVTIIKDDVLLSAMLYQKQESAKQTKINFRVNAHGSQWIYKISQTDLLDILNNLVDNAFEEVAKLAPENRFVQIDFDDHSIEVKNSIAFDFEKVGVTAIDRFFEQGYSTKGTDRGFGLSNVAMIAERNNIQIAPDLRDGLFVIELKFSEN